MGFVLYRSSAGSGKTYTLVKEYLKIILENPQKFKHILAITFTNKAAGEMKERIMQALKKLAKGEDKELEETLLNEMPNLHNIDRISSEILTTLLHNYSDFAIMTIDSFIHKVIKAFALEIGLPLNFTIDLNYERIETYVIEKLMAAVGKDEYITKIILEFVYTRIKEEKSWNIEGDIRKFEKELFNEKNIDWIKTISDFDNVHFYNLMEQLQAICDAYVQGFNDPGRRAMDLIRTAGLSIDDFAYKDKGAAGFLQKCALLRRGGEKDFNMSSRFRDGLWTAKSTGAEIKTAVENLLAGGLQQISREIIGHYDTNRSRALTATAVLNNIYLAAIINRLKLLIDEYKKKNNVIPISEFNVKVYEIVKNSPVPFIYSIIGEKYSHYLIDEFQDTSRLQWENLFPLIDNALASGYFNMAVGDGKQSIYRWRGGDVEIMETDVNNKIHPEQLTIAPLDRNFRSRKNVVDFNNCFFQKTGEFFKKENSLLEHIYSDIAQQPVRKEGGLVTLQFIEDNENEDANTAIFERVKEIIKYCQRTGYDYADIAILVRENKKGRMVAEYLLEQQIPVVSPDSLILSRIPLIRFLVDALTCLNNRADAIAEASMIYFLELNKQQNTPDIARVGDFLMKKKQAKLSREIAEFFNRGEYLIRMPVYEVIEEIIRIFKLPDTLDFQSMGYLQAFLDIAANYMSENSVDISSFLDWWELNKEEFAVVVPETKPAVKIMSIHKAKGLEFPVVVIPYADWEHKPDKQLWLTSNPPLPTEPPLDIPMPVNSAKLLEETFFQDEYREEKEKVLIDNINLLYVAFTRPVDALHIIAQSKKNNENVQLLNELAVPMMEPDREREGRYTFGERTTKEKEKTKPPDLGYEQAQTLISNKWYHRISIRRKAVEFWRFDTGYRAERRNWGILVHQVLSQITSVDDIPRALDRAQTAGDIGADERLTLEGKINQIFALDTVRQWFAPGQKVFAEMPLITPEGVLRPDRVIIAENGVTLIDFKTGEKNKAHAAQVLKYKAAIETMGYERVDAYLFYLETQEAVMVNRETHEEHEGGES